MQVLSSYSKRSNSAAGQRLLASARRDPPSRAIVRIDRFDRGLPLYPVGQRPVVIVASERRIAARCDYFEHALGQAQDRHVEGAAAQVEYRVNPFASVVQSIRKCRRRGLVDQSQHVEARELGRVLGGLALRLVEVSRHGNHRAVQFIVESVFGALAQGGKNLGAQLDRRLLALHRLQPQHAGRVDELVRGRAVLLDIGEATAHEAFERGNRVGGIVDAARQCLVADLPPALFEIAHDRWQQHPALLVRQALCHAVAHRGDKRMGRSEVYPHGDLASVRIGRVAGFGNLQQCHSVVLWFDSQAKFARRISIVPVAPAGHPPRAQSARRT